MNTIKLNVYDNLYTPQISTIPNRITIEDWFELIKSSDFLSEIKLARIAGKGTPAYDKLKAKLPCVTYNFLFKKHKNDNNIAGGTGLIYIDVDPEKDKAFDFDINKLDASKLFAYYKSFGGNGYGILVRVNGLTLNNFRSTYKFILDELVLSNHYDSNAVKATQFNVLSYDPNLYYNPSSYVFAAIEVVNEEFNNDNESNNTNNNFPPIKSEIKKKNTYSHLLGEKSEKQIIRHTNINQFNNIDTEYIEDWINGYDEVKCFLPAHGIKEGKRNYTMFNYCRNLVYLNTFLTPAGVLKILSNVNAANTTAPLTERELKSIVTSVFKYKDADTLKPAINKRKVVFASNSQHSGEERKCIALALLHQHQRNESKQKIYDCIESWDFESNGKITSTAVLKVVKMNKKTVEKYWSEFKDYVKDLNLTNNQIKTKNKPFTMREAQSKASKLTPIESIGVPEQAKLSDVELDASAGLYIANTNLYNQAIAIIDSTDLFNLELTLSKALKTGKTSDLATEVDDYVFRFKINRATNLVEFESVNDGDEILLEVA